MEFKINFGCWSDSRKLVRVWVDCRTETEKLIVWIKSDNKNADVHLKGID